MELCSQLNILGTSAPPLGGGNGLIKTWSTDSWCHRLHHTLCVKNKQNTNLSLYSTGSLQCHSKVRSFLEKSDTLFFTLNHQIQLVWWLLSQVLTWLIAHRVISINNSSSLLPRPHLSWRRNQINTLTLSYGSCMKYFSTKQSQTLMTKIVFEGWKQQSCNILQCFQQIEIKRQPNVTHYFSQERRPTGFNINDFCSYTPSKRLHV